MVFTVESLSQTLKSLDSSNALTVGFSGGLDSTVLLHALSMLRRQQGIVVSAVHIHHGLQQQADVWSAHCARICDEFGVPCEVIRVDATAQPGESPEAAARKARYEALCSRLTDNDFLLTAHHQDDQAETLLLQLLRGAGPAGLSSMPAKSAFGKGWHVRPLLAVSRDELAAYAEQHDLAWIDDESNADIGLDRNYLRHEVIPVLKRRWPAAAYTIARAASHQAGAQHLLKELAQGDLSQLAGSTPATLSAGGLKRLSIERQRNALRSWLHVHELNMPTLAQLEEIRHQMLSPRCDIEPCVHWEGGEVRRYRDDLYAMKPQGMHDASQVFLWDMRQPLPLVGLGITLDAATLAAQGLTQVTDNYLIVKFRQGGERCKPKGRAHHHELKKLFQEAGVPPWQRARIPLLYAGERLVMVFGYWVCE